MLKEKQNHESFNLTENIYTVSDFTNSLKLWVDDHELICEYVIISTGASAKYLGLDSEKKYLKWVNESFSN